MASQAWTKIIFLILFDSVLFNTVFKVGMSVGGGGGRSPHALGPVMHWHHGLYHNSQGKTKWPRDLHKVMRAKPTSSCLHVSFPSFPFCRIDISSSRNVRTVPPPLHRCKPTPIVNSIMLSNYLVFLQTPDFWRWLICDWIWMSEPASKY